MTPIATISEGVRVRDNGSDALGTVLEFAGRFMLIRYDNGQEVYRPASAMTAVD